MAATWTIETAFTAFCWLVQLPLPATLTHCTTDTSINKPQEVLMLTEKLFFSCFNWVAFQFCLFEYRIHYRRAFTTTSQTGTRSVTGGKSNNSDWRLLGYIQPLTSSLLWWIACSDAVIRWLSVYVCERERRRKKCVMCARSNKVCNICNLYFFLWKGQYRGGGLPSSHAHTQCTCTYQTATRSDAWISPPPAEIRFIRWD